MRFLNDVEDSKLDSALDKMFRVIRSHPSDEGTFLIVNLGQFVEKSWGLIYSKLRKSQDIFAKVAYFDFADSSLSLAQLGDLYFLFLQHQETLPHISIRYTPAEKDITKFKDLFPDRKVKKLKRFLRRIKIKDSNKSSKK